MKFHPECVACTVESALRKSLPVADQRLRSEYMAGVCDILKDIDPDYHSAPLMEAKVIAFRRDFLKLTDDYSEEKHRFNGLLLSVYDRLAQRVQAAPDPLLAAMELSIAGNYIDFGVLKEVEEDRLMALLDQACAGGLDPQECAFLRSELENAKNLVMVHDNCGEIVLDKLLIETIKALYPQIHVLSVVREIPVLNDATREDAAEIGLCDLAEVVGNTIPDVPGTQMDMLSPELRRRMEAADLIIAKGQGNFESMQNCGLNIYYLLLAKCEYYENWFGFKRFSGVLANERRFQQL